MSEWMFSPEEQRARIQFRELFLGDYLRITLPPEALHEEPWNAHILEDILRTLHEDNPLVASDIEAIAQIAGLYNGKHELWFGYPVSKVLPRPIVTAISPYITPKAYAQAILALGNKINFSVIRFYTRVCVNTIPKKRVRQSDVFELYTEWCKVMHEEALGKRDFKKEMIARGVPTGKGYVEKQNGVDYYLIACNMSEEAWKYEPAETSQSKEGTEGADPAEPLWDEYRRREEVLCEPLKETTGGVSQNQGRQDTGTGDDRKHEGPDSGSKGNESDDTVVVGPEGDGLGAYTKGDDIVVETPEGIRTYHKDGRGGDAQVNTDGSANDAAGELGSAEPNATEEDSDTGNGNVHSREEIMAAVRKLPPDERQFMKLMKVTYLVSPETFQLDDYMAEWDMAGLPQLEYHRQQEAWDFFMEYCRLK